MILNLHSINLKRKWVNGWFHGEKLFDLKVEDLYSLLSLSI